MTRITHVGRQIGALLVIVVFLAASLAVALPAVKAQQMTTNKPPYEVYGPEARQLLAEVYLHCSPQTKACIGCHLSVTPGIVYDWLRSKHAWHTPNDIYKLYKAIGYDNPYLAPKFQDYPYVVGCYECHGMFKDPKRPDIIQDHFGYKIVVIVTAKDCSQCHYKEAEEMSWTWHAFGALNTWLKPWYAKIVKYAKETGKYYMLPPVYNDTGKAMITWPWIEQYLTKIAKHEFNDPEVKMFGLPMMYLFKNIVSPLYPASGVLAHNVTAGGFVAVYNGTEYHSIMSHPLFSNAYVYLACMMCHGSLVIPYNVTKTSVKYWGWPNDGVGRIDPDGSLGACTSCHPRHTFSIEVARKPQTCGECHLGYDHPHKEVYEESKHGELEAIYGSHWKWEDLPWKVGVDFNAPTCATCHMSTIASPDGKILIKGTHDLRARIVWDSMHFFAFPKPKWPDHTQNAIIKGASQLTGAGLFAHHVAFEGFKIVRGPRMGLQLPNLPIIEYYGELKKHRMEAVCKLCHSPQWVQDYFLFYDANQIDYNITAHFAFELLKYAWKLGIQNPKNKIDEYMEFMWYYIWHHDGRRWRAGAAMMGPDFTHWFGIVDTVMDKLGRMISYYEAMIKIMKIEETIANLTSTGATTASAAKLSKLEQELGTLEAKVAAMEATMPTLKSGLDSLEAKFDMLQSKIRDIEYSAAAAVTKADAARIKAGLAEANTEKLSKQLDQIKAEYENILKKISELATATQMLQQNFAKFKEDTSSKLSELTSQLKKISETAIKAQKTAEFAESKVVEQAKVTSELSRTAKTILGLQGTITLLLAIGAILTVAAVVSLVTVAVRRRP